MEFHWLFTYEVKFTDGSVNREATVTIKAHSIGQALWRFKAYINAQIATETVTCYRVYDIGIIEDCPLIVD